MSENGCSGVKPTDERSIETETHQYRDHTRTHFRVPARVEVPVAVIEEIVEQRVEGERQADQLERPVNLPEFNLEDELWDRLELDIEWVLAGRRCEDGGAEGR
jgi:hypothetical protein